MTMALLLLNQAPVLRVSRVPYLMLNLRKVKNSVMLYSRGVEHLFPLPKAVWIFSSFVGHRDVFT